MSEEKNSNELEAELKNLEVEAELNINLCEINDLIAGIKRAADRLKELVNLQAPRKIIERECRLIKYRAVAVVGAYEALKLLEIIQIDEKE